MPLVKLYMQIIFVIEDDFMAAFNIRAILRFQKIKYFGFGLLSLVPSSAAILDLELCSSTRCDVWIKTSSSSVFSHGKLLFSLWRKKRVWIYNDPVLLVMFVHVVAPACA